MSMQVRCRKCRCLLLDDEAELESHESPTDRPLPFVLKDYRKARTNVMSLTGCTHFFTKELPWMEELIRGVTSGIIPCPRCATKLGNFSWVGLQCSCGAWVVPGFALLKSKIDIFKLRLETQNNDTA